MVKLDSINEISVREWVNSSIDSDCFLSGDSSIVKLSTIPGPPAYIPEVSERINLGPFEIKLADLASPDDVNQLLEKRITATILKWEIARLIFKDTTEIVAKRSVRGGFDSIEVAIAENHAFAPISFVLLNPKHDRMETFDNAQLASVAKICHTDCVSSSEVVLIHDSTPIEYTAFDVSNVYKNNSHVTIQLLVNIARPAQDKMQISVLEIV